jgi:hypothetical protein
MHALPAPQIWRIAYLLYKQVTLDLFLIDHEQSRGTAVTLSSGAGQQNPEQAVALRTSAWRRVLVAKKFNQLQVGERRANDVMGGKEEE